MNNELLNLLDPVIAIAEQAGKAIVPYFAQDRLLKVQHKMDCTLVTEADIAAQAIIKTELQKLTVHYPIVSEEDQQWEEYAIRKEWSRYWLVDPLDGTKGFVNHLPEFSVNIALIENNAPILGVIYGPMTQICYYAAFEQGAYKKQHGIIKRLHGAVFNPNNPRIILGQYHQSRQFLELFQGKSFQLLRMNSSLKFGCLAEGSADIYPRFGPTSEWDTAAGQCLLHEIGGIVVDFAGQSLQYNAKPSLLNPKFIALSDRSALKFLKPFFTGEKSA